MPYADVNGLTIYYEVHGDGSPLLLHRGSGSILEPRSLTSGAVIRPKADDMPSA